MLKASMKPERKYVDATLVNQVFNQSAGATLLNGIAQGDLATQRTGMAVKMLSLDIKLESLSNATATSNISRLLVIRDKQPNGASLTAAGVLTAPTDVNSMYNLGNAFRYQILKDIRWSQTNLSDTQQILRKIHVPLNFTTHWSTTGTGATIADITTNSLYLMYLGDEVTNGASVNAYCRVRFSDL